MHHSRELLFKLRISRTLECEFHQNKLAVWILQAHATPEKVLLPTYQPIFLFSLSFLKKHRAFQYSSNDTSYPLAITSHNALDIAMLQRNYFSTLPRANLYHLIMYRNLPRQVTGGFEIFLWLPVPLIWLGFLLVSGKLPKWQRKRPPREVVKSLSPEVFKRWVHVAPGDMA